MKRQSVEIALLMCLAAVVQAWIVARSVVPAPDAVRVVLMAQVIERDGLLSAMRAEPEPPLFPCWALCVRWVLTSVGWIEARNWAACVQIAAAIPLVLAVLPCYVFLARSAAPAVAAAGSLLFLGLYEIARLGGDGLADSLHLCLYTVALCFAAGTIHTTGTQSSPIFDRNGFRSTRAIRARPLLVGLVVGAALLARAEAAILVPALGATWLWEGRRDKAGAWRPVAASCAWMAAGLAAVIGPYLAASGSLAPRAAALRVLSQRGMSDDVPLNASAREAASALGESEPRWELGGEELQFGAKDYATTTRFRGILAAAREFVLELAQSLQYVVGALVTVGLVARLRRPTQWSSVDRLLVTLCVMHACVVVLVAANIGYLSGRHLLVLVVPALCWAAEGGLLMGQALSGWRPASPRSHQTPSVESQLRDAAALRPGWAAWMVVAVTAIGCLSINVRPLHDRRLGHRLAAGWLAARAARPAKVLDSHGWTALYSGLTTYRYDAAQTAYCDPQLEYVVVERWEREAQTPRGRSMRTLLAQAGEPVADFLADASRPQDQVTLYRWHSSQFRPERFAARPLAAR